MSLLRTRRPHSPLAPSVLRRTHARRGDSSSGGSKPRPDKKKSSRAGKSSQKSSGKGGSWLRFFGVLTLFLLVLGGVLFGGLFLYFSSRLDEAMAGRTWDIPTRLYAAPLTLATGTRVLPGPFEPALEAMGYIKAARVQNPGEYRAAEPGQYYVFARPGWPGLKGILKGPLELRFSDGRVKSLRPVRGEAQERYVLPPVPFAEIRRPEQETRTVVEYKQLPKVLVDAVIAVEDKRFYQHYGVDPIGLTRAVIVNVLRQGRAQGGSTLTQQLAKNYFLTQEKTLLRKVKEVFYALALERRFSKEQILALYMNEIYLGQRGPVPISGMAQASYAFFSKEIGQLTLAEAALLAGIIQSPNAYAPERHAERAKGRRDVVLTKMLEQGKITQEAFRAATATPIKLRPGPYLGRTAPFFVDYVSEQVSDHFPEAQLSVEGFAVETSLDLRIQQASERALSAHLQTLQKGSKVPLEGAVVAMQPSTGRILAMVGGKRYADSQFNRAVMAHRQPGSVFKPLVILTALQARGRELGPTTILKDEPLTLTQDGKNYTPQNNDKQFHGDVTLREVLEQSLNVATVRLATDVGMQKMVDMLKRLGISGKLKPLPSLALGAYDATPLEVAAAFSAIANGGTYHTPYALKRVLSAEGDVLWEPRSEGVPVAEAQHTWLVRDMMRGVLDRGTAKSARTLGYTFPASGKTGTTNDARDAWFVGFDADLLVVVWVGADQNQPIGLTGGKAALPVWVQIMKEVRRSDAPPRDPMPEGLELRTVCAESLVLPTETCPDQQPEVFWSGKTPTESCPLHPPPTVLDRIFAEREANDSGPSDRPAEGPRPLKRLFQRLLKGMPD